MSYCRWSKEHSDVYVYAHVVGGWTTHIVGEDAFSDPTPSDCADRLEGLRAKGYRVPQYAIDRLRREALGPSDCDLEPPLLSPAKTVCPASTITESLTGQRIQRSFSPSSSESIVLVFPK